jgi:hypothetical protein
VSTGRKPTCEPVTEVECTILARGPEDLCQRHLDEFLAWQQERNAESPPARETPASDRDGAS